MLPADKAMAAIALSANNLVNDDFMGFSWINAWIGTCLRYVGEGPRFTLSYGGPAGCYSEAPIF